MRRSLVSFALFASLAGCLGDINTPPAGDPSGTPPPQNQNNGNQNQNPDPQPGASADLGTAWDLAGPPSPMGTISLTMTTSTDSIRLNESKDYKVTVMPENGFDGMVLLSVENAPAGVSATFNPPGATMTAPAAQTLTLTLKTDSGMTPAPSMPITIKATSGAISATTTLTLTVTAELLVTSPNGVNVGSSTSPNTSAFGATSIPVIQVAQGTKVTFVNADSINHEIHSDGTLGIQHEPGPLMANEANSYTQTFNGTGTFNFHCHIHPGMMGQIVVK